MVDVLLTIPPEGVGLRQRVPFSSLSLSSPPPFPLPSVQLVSSSVQTVDFQDLFAKFTFDSVCTLGFGVDVDSLSGNARDVQVRHMRTEGL